MDHQRWQQITVLITHAPQSNLREVPFNQHKCPGILTQLIRHRLRAFARIHHGAQHLICAQANHSENGDGHQYFHQGKPPRSLHLVTPHKRCQ